MNIYEIPEKILADATDEIDACRKDFPEDEWITLSDNYELNLFTTSSGEQIGTIHPVEKGRIDTQNFVRIYHQRFIEKTIEDKEFMQFQLEEDARMEAEWLASREAPFADRALDDIPDDVDLDELADDDYTHTDPDTEIYPLHGGGYAIVAPGCGFAKPLGQILSEHDPYGIYTPDGRQIGSTCGCEDYPCCGH